LFQHTFGTHPEKPLPTGYKGFPFIVWGGLPGVCVWSSVKKVTVNGSIFFANKHQRNILVFFLDCQLQDATGVPIGFRFFLHSFWLSASPLLSLPMPLPWKKKSNSVQLGSFKKQEWLV